MKSRVRQINLYRMMLRYCIAAIGTSMIIGTVMNLYDQIIINTSREHNYIRTWWSWVEDCGIVLSIMLIPILIYAALKQFILRRNDNFWLNALMFVLIIYLFLLLSLAMTWGLGIHGNFEFIGFLFVLTPFALFPLILKISGKFIGPFTELPGATT